jgi:hypothetical protein
MAETTGSRMDAVKAGMKRALITFLVADALLIAGALAIYLWCCARRSRGSSRARPRGARRDGDVGAGARGRGKACAPGRRLRGAKRAADDMLTSLDGPREAVSGRARALRGADSQERAMLIQNEIPTDPVSARSDFELLDAKLAVLYPVATK